MDTVPYIVYESSMARAERTIKRLWILALVIVFLLVASNIGWLIYESQFETITETMQEVWQEADSGGLVAICVCPAMPLRRTGRDTIR